MFKFGLILEGYYDEQFLRHLIGKIFSGEHQCICRIAGGSRLLNRSPGFLEEFRYLKVDKALIIRDQNHKCRKEIIEDIRGKISGRTFPFPVKIHIIEREMETWLLADEKALSNVVGRQVPRIKGNLEDIKDPKTKLVAILSAATLAYTGELAGRIVAAADLETIATRCPGFRRFKQSVLDC